MSSIIEKPRTMQQLMKHPVFIGVVALVIMVGYVLPEISNSNEATLGQYMTVDTIASTTQCESTRAKIREALVDGRLTSAEIASISGNSKSAACDRDVLMERIAANLK